MHLKNLFGTYIPSYLLIQLQTTDPLDNISELEQDYQRTFFHEYTHFLQNITGGFGHSHIWNTYDRLRQIISDLQLSGVKEFDIPVKNVVTEHQQLLLNVLATMSGRYSTPGPLNDESVFIKEVNIYQDESFKKLYPEKKNYFLNCTLEDDKGQKQNYAFGESAVSETMAVLMENKMFGAVKMNSLPYNACQLLGRYLQTEFVENDEWLFALCDAAMVTSYPGMSFYYMLLEIWQDEFKPSNTEEIYEFTAKVMKQRGWDVIGNFKENKAGAIKVFNDLFHFDVVRPTRNWFIHLFETGFQKRIDDPYFMLNIYREKTPYEGRWQDVNALFGTPQLYNASFDRYFRAPKALGGEEDKIEPLFLISLQQIHETLFRGKQNCELIECCRKSKNGIEISYACKSGPWQRAADDPTCAYGGLWAGFGLSPTGVK